MRNQDLLFRRLLSVWFLSTFAISAHAQTDDVRSRIADMVAMTRPGYYIQKYVLAVADIDPCLIVSNCRATPLPVTLLYFTGERKDDRLVLLQWETDGEVNNDYFQIERTLNPALGFETVATVKGSGTSTRTVKYQMPDKNEYETYTYYRLKQVDFDGTYKYSTMIAVKGAENALTVTAFPNPGQAKNIGFRMSGLGKTSSVDVTVYDVNGRLIYQNKNVAVSPEQDLRINLPNVPTGKYHIKVAAGNREAVNSFVLIR